MPNLFRAIPESLPAEAVEVLYQSAAVRIERIVSRGHASAADDWYDQDQDEFVLLLSGWAEIVFDAPPARLRLEPGDYLTIPAHRRHRV